MHQIRFRLGLCPRPRWGSLQRSPDPIAGFKGAYFLGGTGGKERGWKGGKGGKGSKPKETKPPSPDTEECR